MADESRFAHLLEPIRDLAQNWNIDLASELEEYLAELEHITISFDGGATSLNFTEAALLIQGSACVYSKKVEYLYALLYQTLDVLAEKRKQQKSSINKEGADSDAPFVKDEPDFLELEDVLVEGKAIDLRQDGDVDYGEERKSTMLLRPPISLLSDVGSGMRDEGESQFKISNCVVHTSGALLLEDKGQNVVDRNFERVRSAVSDLPFGSPKVVMGAARSADSGVQHELQSAEDASLQMRPHALNFGAEAHPGGEAAQLDDGGSDGGDNYNYGPYLGREASASADVVGEEDPWALLDPHAASLTIRDRPLKKARPPKAAEELKTWDHSAIWKVDDTVDVFNMPVRLGTFRSTVFPEFADYVDPAFKRIGRATFKRTASKKSGASEPSDDAGGGDDDDLAWPDDGAEENDDDGPATAAAAAPAALEPRPAASKGLDALDAASDDSMVKTYEQLCQEHVANYLKSAERYATETQLARRVGEWQQRLTPLLEAEERHRAFDIFSYGEEVIDTLAKRDEAKAGQEIELDQLLRGKERFEVCRLFLATLQLANNGNVDIVHKPREDDSEADPDHVVLHLLKTELHRPDMESAASAEPAPEIKVEVAEEASRTSVTTKGKRARASKKVKTAAASAIVEAPSSDEAKVAASSSSNEPERPPLTELPSQEPQQSKAAAAQPQRPSRSALRKDGRMPLRARPHNRVAFSVPDQSPVAKSAKSAVDMVASSAAPGASGPVDDE